MLRVVRLALIGGLPLVVLMVCLLLLHGAQAAPAADSGAMSMEWPPVHKDLSASGDHDSGGAEIDANEQWVVVVWTEGLDAANTEGRIKMRWIRAGTWVWQERTIWEPSERFGQETYVGYNPAVALDEGYVAHVVWAVKDAEGQGGSRSLIYHLQWNLKDNTGPHGSEPWESYDAVSRDSTAAKSAPRVALDANQVPHVVWVEMMEGLGQRVFYNNGNAEPGADPSWMPKDVVVSGGSDAYAQDNPAIAAGDRYVYVAWDENYKGSKADAGIYVRRRNQITPTAQSSLVLWTTTSEQISDAGSKNDPLIDGFPTIGIDEEHDWLYVMWQRLEQQRCNLLGTCVYTYSLPYRVLTGTEMTQDWWPGIGTKARAYVPFTSTSAVSETTDYYTGLAPTLEMVGSKPHLVWHHSSPAVGGGGGEGEQGNANSLDVGVQEVNEALLSRYLVSYAHVISGELGSAVWVSTTVSTRAIPEAVRFWTGPDLAVAPYGGETYLHVVVHQRNPSGSQYAWNVWYVNEYDFYWLYMPALDN